MRELSDRVLVRAEADYLTPRGLETKVHSCRGQDRIKLRDFCRSQRPEDGLCGTTAPRAKSF
jgi:hypothetical protein